MQKLPFKSSWLFLLIPIGMIYFVFVPQIQKQYERYNKQQITLQNDIRTLDSLKHAKKLNRKGTHLLKKLEITVPVHQKVYGKQKFLYYKTGGMLLVLVFMGIGMLVTSYLSNRKKTSSKNKQIDFIFDDFTTDQIGQTISWDGVESSGSNFASETFKKTAQGYKITGSSFTKVFAWSFFLIGLNYVAVSFYEFYQTSDIPLTFMKGGKLFFTSGGVFLIVGVILLFMFSPKAYIYTRKRKIIVGAELLTFQQVHALQVLEKFISGSSSSGSYFSYELNLITKNGVRYNLLNHGDKTYILSDMLKISKLLKVPVWNNGVV
ncbi:hypothetical protein PJW08_01930 [Tenacibaculum finnmarkense]|uniref:hypothetical protein n=1 Tax=Tenacibaculum finnmarkense TaxID=2781243 RepID=UPI001E5345FF|nr:hypothetical protein [Tenacibaculum finnmarkense]MCD8453754.1 hypothetical protein [Tenacibaculum finnmarkense genomovar ulcerans]WCC45047.1 hypothetical protein PJW08_01930 [Tenacibaculum finnmarkense]